MFEDRTQAETSGDVDRLAEVRVMCEDPAGYFGHSHTAMQTIPREKLARLQLEGVKHRFDDLRNRIPMLKKLADSQSIDAIDSIDDIVPLLFEHTVYKSYPPSLLENGRFADINRFLGKLTTIDLSQIDVSHCKTIDDWMETMDRESPLSIIHSSGTSGTMSFLPVSKREWDKFGATLKVACLQEFGDDAASAEGDELYAIYPFFRYGGSGHIRQCDFFVKHFTGREDRLFTAYPGRMSSDLLYLGAKIRAAIANGTVGQLKISPALLARKAEYERLQAEMPEHMDKFFAELSERLRGKRIFFSGAIHLIYGMAEAGLKKGLDHVFAPNSVISTGGDVKEGSIPSDWREKVCRFIGIHQTLMCYGMSEVGGLHYQCDLGRYHIVPWVVPFVLDPDTSEVLPRAGRTTGRAAFFDLGAETRWGGFITGDEVTVDWDTECPCGRSSVFIEGKIQRFSDKRGGDDKISCAASEGAHADAMTFLTSF